MNQSFTGGGFMSRELIERTSSFRWNSRFELYQYFKEKYNIDSDMVDATINRVMASFKPRVGQIVKTQELWQKVGLVLEEYHQINHLISA
jgi:hypothetical protein